MNCAPKSVLLGGCLVLCALNFYDSVLNFKKGYQHPIDSSAVNVYSYPTDSRSHVPVQASGRREQDYVSVFVLHAYDDSLIRGVAVPNLVVLAATLSLFLLVERNCRTKTEPNQSLQPTAPSGRG